jgi:pyrroloquinoline quinone (PQQ) biosynthesis protein C
VLSRENGDGSINLGEGERWRQLIWDMTATSCGDEEICATRAAACSQTTSVNCWNTVVSQTGFSVTNSAIHTYTAPTLNTHFDECSKKTAYFRTQSQSVSVRK